MVKVDEQAVIFLLGVLVVYLTTFVRTYVNCTVGLYIWDSFLLNFA